MAIYVLMINNSPDKLLNKSLHVSVSQMLKIEEHQMSFYNSNKQHQPAGYHFSANLI